MNTAEQNYQIGAQKRDELQREINNHPIVIDRACFRKTKQEKEDLDFEQRKFRDSGGLHAWNDRNRPGNN